ncbi:hypothetical protein PR202_ga19895 [Eleusine coracana subsp. coracana]|uniref:F-box domain-containing protein n=1 Tax=Eleusine coracana subsp. coracana TaxID=191504 RepID=A0AAV5CVE8_ELECO|nr:hypothetical protein PR202_ga19895 [Eleusine coracana subsp. coracana]
MGATAELLRHDSTKIEAAVTKDVEQEDQEDRLSNLPDDILTLILERLKLHEAARTSILSRRWVHLFSQRSRIVIDIGAFNPKDQVSESTLDDLAKSNASLIQATKTPVKVREFRKKNKAELEALLLIDRGEALPLRRQGH